MTAEQTTEVGEQTKQYNAALGSFGIPDPSSTIRYPS